MRLKGIRAILIGTILILVAVNTSGCVLEISGNRPLYILSEPYYWKCYDRKVSGWEDVNFNDSGWYGATICNNSPPPNVTIIGMENTKAQWIWDPRFKVIIGPGDHYYFRRKFDIPAYKVVSGTIKVTAVNEYELYVNGSYIGRGQSWADAESYSISNYLNSGANVIAIKVINRYADIYDGLLVDASISYQW